MKDTMQIGDLTLEESGPFFVIAGPCVIEDDRTTLRVAGFLREAMEAMFVRLLTGTGMFRESHRTDSVKRIRFLAPGVASVDDYWVVEGVLSDRPHIEGLYNWVMVKQDGRWLTAVHHATNFAPRPASPAGDGR